jgi:hypothetical protein
LRLTLQRARTAFPSLLNMRYCTRTLSTTQGIEKLPHWKRSARGRSLVSSVGSPSSGFSVGFVRARRPVTHSVCTLPFVVAVVSKRRSKVAVMGEPFWYWNCDPLEPCSDGSVHATCLLTWNSFGLYWTSK